MTEDDLNEDEVRTLSEMTSRLPRDIDPPADAWLAVKAEIEAPRIRPAPAFWQRPAFLAAAGLVLVAGSSGITALLIGGRSVERPPVQVAMSDPSTATPSLAEFATLENEYIGTANRLSAMLESEQMQLSPETVAKMKESLRIIDAAILEARRALVEDPANRQLIEMLAATYGKKIDFLRRTTEMGRS